MKRIIWLTKFWIWSVRKSTNIEIKIEKGITNENGKEIKRIENINAYAGEVVRLVWLEHYRKHLKNRVDNENAPILTVQPEENAADESNVRVRCLRKCIAEKIPDEKAKQLILGYYDDESNEKNKIIRENLREKLGLSKANFKTKACRLRERLENVSTNASKKLTKITAFQDKIKYRKNIWHKMKFSVTKL